MSAYAPSRVRSPVMEEKKGFSPAAFYIALIMLIILAIIVIILIILYFRKGSDLINPADCPAGVTGLGAEPDTTVATPATNCGSNATCTYTVTSLQQAQTTCSSLGPSKCAKFSLAPVNNSNNYTLTISSSTATSSLTGSNSYRIA